MTNVMTNSPTTVVAKDCVVEESPPPAKYVSSQKRCAEYNPNLEELKDTTFEEYVRGEILGVPLPGYEFLYVYEDKDGREMKREVPVGQQYAGIDADLSSAQAVTSSDESSSRSTSPPSPKKKEDEARTTRSQSQAKRGTSSKNSDPSHEPPHERYRMCFHKLRDGMAKVTLPTGFWAKTDTTARGRLVSILSSLHLFLKHRLLTPS